jgi:hypothetical protein
MFISKMSIRGDVCYKRLMIHNLACSLGKLSEEILRLALEGKRDLIDQGPQPIMNMKIH